MKHFTLAFVLMAGMAGGQEDKLGSKVIVEGEVYGNQPITFCAKDDDAARQWIRLNKLEGKRVALPRPDSDRSGCLDRLKPYEAVAPPPPPEGRVVLHSSGTEGVPQWVYKDKFGNLCAVGQKLKNGLCFSPKSKKPAKKASNGGGVGDSSAKSFGELNSLGLVANFDGWCANEDMKAVPCPSPEPLDVPAIQEDYVSAKKGDQVPSGQGWLMYYGEDQHSKRWTCADKSRILEHDEQTPSKYWCRKVQP